MLLAELSGCLTGSGPPAPLGPVDISSRRRLGGAHSPVRPILLLAGRQLTQAKPRPVPTHDLSSSPPNAAPPPRSPGTGIFRLTYPAPGAIIALPCPLQAFGLHASNCLNRHTDDALRLPGLVQLEIIPPTAAGLCGGFRLDLPWAVIRGVSAEHRDLFTTARHMNGP